MARTPHPGRRPLRTRIWRRVRQALGRPAADPPPGEPPDLEPALVPAGPPRPTLSGAVALEPPAPPEDVDARGRDG